MDIASNGNNMEQWQDMEISPKKPADMAPLAPISNGLDVEPNLLHDEFHQHQTPSMLQHFAYIAITTQHMEWNVYKYIRHEFGTL